MRVDLSTLGTVGAAVLTALALLFGAIFKRGQDKRDAKIKTDAAADAARAAQDALNAANAQAVYDQLSEALAANRTELRAAQTDITNLRAASEDLWSKMGAMRRTLNAYEAHIAAWNRWADGGSVGPRPAPIQDVA